MELEESKIIKACQSGNLQEFALIYDFYAKKIYSFIYFKTHHRQLAEDLTSQTFFRALESIKKYDDRKGRFSSWLYRIARNKVIDYYRSRKNELEISDVWGLKSEDDLTRDSYVKEQLAKAKKLLADLTQEQREIVIMRVWDGLSYREIAEILGKSEAGCKMAFSRAIKSFKKEGLSIFAVLLLAAFLN